MLQREGGSLGLLDPVRTLDEPQLDELGPQVLEVAAARELACKLAHDDDRGCRSHRLATVDGAGFRIEHEPLERLVRPERDEVDASAGESGLGREHGGHLAVRARRRRDQFQLFAQLHTVRLRSPPRFRVP